MEYVEQGQGQTAANRSGSLTANVKCRAGQFGSQFRPYWEAKFGANKALAVPVWIASHAAKSLR